MDQSVDSNVLRALSREFAAMSTTLRRHMDAFVDQSGDIAAAYGSLENTVGAARQYGRTADALMVMLMQLQERYAEYAELLLWAGARYEATEQSNASSAYWLD